MGLCKNMAPNTFTVFHRMTWYDRYWAIPMLDKTKCQPFDRRLRLPEINTITATSSNSVSWSILPSGNQTQWLVGKSSDNGNCLGKNGLRNGICHCYAWLLECKHMVEERHGSCNSKSFPKSSRHVINLGTSSVSSSSTSASIGSTDSSPEGSSAAPGASGASGAQRCETSPVLRAGWSNMKEPRVPTIVLLCSILVDMAGRTSYRNPGSV